MVPTAPFASRVYLDSDTVDVATFLTIRRAYEHSYMRRYPLDDVTSTNAPWSILLPGSTGQHVEGTLTASYRHSAIDYVVFANTETTHAISSHDQMAEVVTIRGGDGDVSAGVYLLSLFDGKRKPPLASIYSGTLEIVSRNDSSGRVSCDRRLDHHHVYTKPTTATDVVSYYGRLTGYVNEPSIFFDSSSSS